jgi:hypothetical protein
MRAYGRAYQNVSAEELSNMMRQVFTLSGNLPEHILTSMELFAAARLEMTERARYVALVSALEPLASAQELTSEVGQLVNQFQEQLRDAESIPIDVRNSLDGRIQQLRYESIRQAIKRTVRTLLPDDPNAFNILDRAYALRSIILHEGARINDLVQRSAEVENYLRRMYAAMIGHELCTPPIPV